MMDRQQDQFTETQAFALWVYFLLGGIIAFSELAVWQSRGQKPILLVSLV